MVSIGPNATVGKLMCIELGDTNEPVEEMTVVTANANDLTVGNDTVLDTTRIEGELTVVNNVTTIRGPLFQVQNTDGLEDKMFIDDNEVVCNKTCVMNDTLICDAAVKLVNVPDSPTGLSPGRLYRTGSYTLKVKD